MCEWLENPAALVSEHAVLRQALPCEKDDSKKERRLLYECRVESSNKEEKEVWEEIQQG